MAHHNDDRTAPDLEFFKRLEDFPGEIEETPPRIEGGPIVPQDGQPMSNEESFRWNQEQAEDEELRTPAQAKPDPPADPCRDPACQFYDACGVRGLAAAPVLAGDDGGDPPADASEADQGKEGPCFEIMIESCGRVGTLVLAGAVEAPGNVAAVKEMLGELPTLAGLLICIVSRGGEGKASDRLEEAVLAARIAVPTVSFIGLATSGAVQPALAADRVVADGGAVVGGFGVAHYFCDGEAPRFLVNRQSPGKCGGGQPDFPPTVFAVRSAEEQEQIVASMSCQYEKLLAAMARYRGRPADTLRPWLDGRTLLAREALRAGLIDAIGDWGSAYADLITMIKRGRHIHQLDEIRAEALKRPRPGRE